MPKPCKFRFLNQDGELNCAEDWNSTRFPKLWLYNLHYFDDLNAFDAPKRRKWHHALVTRWITENPPGLGVAWDPYPLSLRIVNWIKWSLGGNRLEEQAIHSLAIQARFLTNRIEHHLLGNHLFSNAKALIFAGCFFDGEEAANWLRNGIAILEREIPEQILPDGGHFERSTMYHALAFEDMLDLLNLSLTYPLAFAPWPSLLTRWSLLIPKMAGWLASMCHPDGEISFFNDAATGIAPSPKSLFNYAQRLGHGSAKASDGVTWLKDSGYIRVQRNNAVLIIDVAPVGPDYLPGHAHADTLSYELSIFHQRVIVNSGTSRYGLGSERLRERGTAAHSTVEVDAENSSEVWAGFRVARRAYPFDISIREDGTNAVVVEAAHDGYRRLPGAPVHRRRWVFNTNCLHVHDWVEGSFSKAISHVHLHPSIQLDKTNSSGTANWDEHVIHWQVINAESEALPSTWHPEFGISQPSQQLAIRFCSKSEQQACQFSLEWN